MIKFVTHFIYFLELSYKIYVFRKFVTHFINFSDCIQVEKDSGSNIEGSQGRVGHHSIRGVETHQQPIQKDDWFGQDNRQSTYSA